MKPENSAKKVFLRCVTVMTMSLIALSGMLAGVKADETDARRLLKHMADFMATQKSFSFDYDAILEVVTTEGQKVGLASSGTAVFSRPDKVRVSRTGGFADLELIFDGTTLTLLGKNLNVYTQLDVPGSIDNLINVLEKTYELPFPAADLLLTNSYAILMSDVIDVKDLGSGVIGGIACDHLAFRTEDVDWQIWIGRGEHPYPYRYTITSKLIEGAPQYSVQTSNWQSGKETKTTDFSFKNVTDAKKVGLKDLKNIGEVPDHYTKGETK